jgi:hypothetical protein
VAADSRDREIAPDLRRQGWSQAQRSPVIRS